MKLLSRLSLRLLPWALACATTAVSAAPTTMELRVFGIDTTVIPTQGQNQGQTVETQGRDFFVDGNYQTGMSYSQSVNGLSPATLTGGYASAAVGPALGFATGAERTSAASDFAGTKFGVGGLSFSRIDAPLSTSNLTPSPFNAYSTSLIPSFDSTNSTGAVFGAGAFDTFAIWNFAQLRPGEVMGLATNGSSGQPSSGRLFVRYYSDYLTGELWLAFEQESRDAFGTRTRTPLAQVRVSDLLTDLSDVDYIGFDLEKDFDSSSVHARVSLLDASLNNVGDLRTLASTNFNGIGATFVGNASGRSTPFAFATWLDPEPVVAGRVPEPATWLLVLVSLLGLGVSRQRRARA